MKKFKLKKWGVPFTFLSLFSFSIIQAAPVFQDDFYDFHQEGYISFSMGTSQLMNVNAYSLEQALMPTYPFNSSVDWQNASYYTGKDIHKNNFYIEKVAPNNQASNTLLMQATKLNTPLLKTRTGGQDNYQLIKDKFTVNTNEKPIITGAKDILNPEPLMLFGKSQKTTHVSTTLGSKAFNSNLFFYGIEVHFSYFKASYEQIQYLFSLPAGTTLINDKNGKNTAHIDSIESNVVLANVSNQSITSNTKLIVNPKSVSVSGILPTFKASDDLQNAISFNTEYKKNYAMYADIILGKRLILKGHFAFDIYAILGYGLTQFKFQDMKSIHARAYDQQGNIVSKDSQDNINLSSLIMINEKNLNKNKAKGLRYGVGTTVYLSKDFGVFVKYIHNQHQDLDLLGNKLTSRIFDFGIELRF